MIILGIDPGFARMGYAVINKENGKLSLLEAGTIETSAKAEHSKRLLSIHNGLKAIIDRHNPSILSIEKLFFASNQKTAIPVAEARGVALLTGALRNLTVYEYTPPELKLAVAGNGTANKKAIEKMICLTLRLEQAPKLDDTADAIALAITAAYDSRKKY